MWSVVSESCTWSGVCNFVVFSVIVICYDYGCVHVFQVCFVCCLWCFVDVCGVVCVVEYWLLYASG